ncbi:hypothetical protein [Winogradskyella vidalii]|uniref:hypothetical protein n=1 Tax=Winogradskyella vidalii TaxID=2615024 RepID=UPI001C544B09|nr:hypothetical protein [Winogradskyella vidalii]
MHINKIKAPISTIYQTLISVNRLGNVGAKKLKMKPEVGFTNEFDFDEGYITKFKITELKESHKIV